MKRTIIRRVFGLSLVVSFSLALASLAQAAMVVNVDFNQSGNPGGTYIGLGAAPDTGTYFNPANIGGTSYTPGPLLASDGVTPTSVTFSLNNYNTFTATGNPAIFAGTLLNDFAYDANSAIGSLPASGQSPVLFSINGLQPNRKYDLYLYSQNGGYNNQTTKFTFGTNSQTIANSNITGGPAGFVLNSNYVLFSSLAANNSGTIAGSFVSNETNNYSTLNGFQIVELPIPAPEPTSAILLGAGLFGLMLRRRKQGQK